MISLQLNYKLLSSAKSWLGTPYVLGQRVKGQGTDCVNFLVGSAEYAGMTPYGAVQFVEPLPLDWSTAPTYMEDRLAEAEEELVDGLSFDALAIPSDKKQLWRGSLVLPGDLLLLATYDLPTIPSHAVIVDICGYDVIRFVHAWNTESGGSVRYGYLGKYFVPYKRYRVVGS